MLGEGVGVYGKGDPCNRNDIATKKNVHYTTKYIE